MQCIAHVDTKNVGPCKDIIIEEAAALFGRIESLLRACSFASRKLKSAVISFRSSPNKIKANLFGHLAGQGELAEKMYYLMSIP